jgi:hypothetical protein
VRAAVEERDRLATFDRAPDERFELLARGDKCLPHRINDTRDL